MTFSDVKQLQGIKLLVIVLSCLWGLNACSTATTAEKGSGDEGDPRVEYKERHFSTKLAVLDLKERDIGGLLQVNATLRNKWGMSLRFQYQFRFFDKDGFPVNQESRPWIPILITGGDEVDVTALAPNPSAKTFTIVIQRALIKPY
ncbi:MAG: YcfL family protein [Sinobacterium sp.]|nr:YcfL family protein [Sinobacterium sp.]